VEPVGRVEVFEISDYEQLIGCELYAVEGNFAGLSWIKMKIN
jgi:hydroxypyruvate isomerase